MREKNPVTHDEKLAYLRELREEAIHAGSEEAVEKQHAKGKLTARERIDKLLDPGSFEKLDSFVRHRTHEFDMDKRRPYGAPPSVAVGPLPGGNLGAALVIPGDAEARPWAVTVSSAQPVQVCPLPNSRG